MVDQVKLYTVAELEAMPDDGTRRELIEGVLIELPAPKPDHNWIMALLVGFLTTHVLQKRIGKVILIAGCQLSHDPDTLLFPDAGYFSSMRLGDHDLNEYLLFAPDIAVEIISPSNTQEEISTKTALYLRHGAQIVWAIYPKSQLVYVYRADGTYQIVGRDGTLDGGTVLPGFSLKVSALFENN